MAALVVSYARADRPKVRQLIGLMRHLLRPYVERAVFWDDDFEPGMDWFLQFTRAVDESSQVFVLWCSHSATSAQVQREYGYALEHSKTVVPVLLDDTQLPSVLADVHGIDFREFGGHDILNGDWPTGTSGSGLIMESVESRSLFLPTVVLDQFRDALLSRGHWRAPEALLSVGSSRVTVDPTALTVTMSASVQNLGDAAAAATTSVAYILGDRVQAAEAERRLTLAPQQQWTYTLPLRFGTAQDFNEFVTRAVHLSLRMTAEYVERGRARTYVFEGTAKPSLDYLDAVRNETT